MEKTYIIQSWIQTLLSEGLAPWLIDPVVDWPESHSSADNVNGDENRETLKARAALDDEAYNG
jgi:hypothetical protein